MAEISEMARWDPEQNLEALGKSLNYSWLVVSTHLKNISQLGSLFPVDGKIKNVPNRQPDYHWTIVSVAVGWFSNYVWIPVFPTLRRAEAMDQNPSFSANHSASSNNHDDMTRQMSLQTLGICQIGKLKHWEEIKPTGCEQRRWVHDGICWSDAIWWCIYI